MSEDEQRFDGILLSLAEQHKNGVPDLLGTIASFLSRKTDFFTGGKDGEWEKLLLGVFREASKAKEVAEKKRKEREAAEKRRQEVLKKKREQEEQDNGGGDDAAIRELTDEEADKLQKEIDEKKKAKDSQSTAPIVSTVPKSNVVDDDEEDPKEKVLQPETSQKRLTSDDLEPISQDNDDIHTDDLRSPVMKDTEVIQASDEKPKSQVEDRNEAKANPEIRKSSRLAAKGYKMQPKSHDNEQVAGPSKRCDQNALVPPTRQAGKDKTSIKHASESWKKRKYKGKRKDRTSYFQGQTLKLLNFEEELVDVESI